MEAKIQKMEQINTSTLDGRYLYAAVLAMAQVDSNTANVKDQEDILEFLHKAQGDYFEGADNVSEISFESALRDLINQFSMEAGSDTQDFVLAKYLCNCLAAYGAAMKSRKKLTF